MPQCGIYPNLNPIRYVQKIPLPYGAHGRHAGRGKCNGAVPRTRFRRGSRRRVPRRDDQTARKAEHPHQDGRQRIRRRLRGEQNQNQGADRGRRGRRALPQRRAPSADRPRQGQQFGPDVDRARVQDEEQQEAAFGRDRGGRHVQHHLQRHGVPAFRSQEIRRELLPADVRAASRWRVRRHHLEPQQRR